MHLGYDKEQQILILLFRGGVQIEGTLDGSEILAVSPHHLALFTPHTLPEECLQISFSSWTPTIAELHPAQGPLFEPLPNQ